MSIRLLANEMEKHERWTNVLISPPHCRKDFKDKTAHIPVETVQHTPFQKKWTLFLHQDDVRRIWKDVGQTTCRVLRVLSCWHVPNFLSTYRLSGPAFQFDSTLFSLSNPKASRLPSEIQRLLCLILLYMDESSLYNNVCYHYDRPILLTIFVAPFFVLISNVNDGHPICNETTSRLVLNEYVFSNEQFALISSMQFIVLTID